MPARGKTRAMTLPRQPAPPITPTSILVPFHA
jgi:hypothetical protein